LEKPSSIHGDVMGIQPSKLGIYVIGLNDDTMAAWWLTYRSEKYESQLE